MGAGVPKFERGLDGSNRKKSTGDREIGSARCQIPGLKPKKDKFSGNVVLGGTPLGASILA